MRVRAWGLIRFSTLFESSSTRPSSRSEAGPWRQWRRVSRPNAEWLPALEDVADGFAYLAGAGQALLLGAEPGTERIDQRLRPRLADGAARLTIKGEREGIARAEYEYEIPERDAREMLERLCMGTPIAKTRYEVEHGGRTWEIDVFEDANDGLVLAEVELESEDEPVEAPAWTGREVSDDERYYNAYLARHPFDGWES